MAASSLGIRVYGYDNDPELVNFWQAVIADKPALTQAFKQFWPLPTQSDFNELQNHYPYLPDSDKAGAFLALNRRSWGGMVWKSATTKVFNPKKDCANPLKKIHTLPPLNFSVQMRDFRESIPKHADSFLYLDPPYWDLKIPYGNQKDTKAFNHQALRDILGGRGRWILSYNDVAQIRDLYQKFQILSVEWAYCLGLTKQGQVKRKSELLICSSDISIPAGYFLQDQPLWDVVD